MVLKKSFILFFLAWSLSFLGQTSIKTMFYNVLNYDSNLESRTRTQHLKTILDTVAPDLFMVCELKNEVASNYLFQNAILPHNSNFTKAPFQFSKSPATGLLQMVYYNETKLILENAAIIPTNVRDINHYTFILNTINKETNPIKIEVFVTHLKASRGASNRRERLFSIESFINELEKLPVNSNIIFAGDFNFYTSNEEGFLTLIDESNYINIVDPINRLCLPFPDDGRDYFGDDYDATYFWNNSSFADVHSQSTRTSPLDDGSGGGMDDRFDFILVSKNLTNASLLSYKENSYKTIGNNGNCYNSFVNSSSCSGTYSQSLRDALHQFSDHLPITLTIQTQETTLSSEEINTIKFINSNIARNHLRIQLKNKEIRTINIYNQLGQKIKTINTHNQQEIYINLESFSTGIYYLSANNIKPQKFLKI